MQASSGAAELALEVRAGQTSGVKGGGWQWRDFHRKQQRGQEGPISAGMELFSPLEDYLYLLKGTGHRGNSPLSFLLVEKHKYSRAMSALEQMRKKPGSVQAAVKNKPPSVLDMV